MLVPSHWLVRLCSGVFCCEPRVLELGQIAGECGQVLTLTAEPQGSQG